MKKTITLALLCLISCANSAKVLIPKELLQYKRSTVVIHSVFEHDNGKGTGAFINDNGLILTAAHVVNEAKESKVVLYTEEVYIAKVVRVDTERDLALIKIDAATPCYFKVGNTAVIGEKILILGNPLSTTYTFSEGIVSNYVNGNLLTDCMVNPGSSGGPVINKNGELIGIVSAMYIGTFESYVILGALVGPVEITKFLKEVVYAVK